MKYIRFFCNEWFARILRVIAVIKPYDVDEFRGEMYEKLTI